MTDLPIWLPQWCCNGCMATYTVGDVATLGLTFEGEAESVAARRDGIELVGDGLVEVAGTVIGAASSDPEDQGRLIASGKLRFAVEDWRFEHPESATNVHCVGKLLDDPTGPTGRTTGRVISMQWRPSIRTLIGDSGYTLDGYEPGEPVRTTALLPEARDGIVQMTLRLT